jgi:pimeloyl-ACP methyl ester carboxylesterase
MHRALTEVLGCVRAECLQTMLVMSIGFTALLAGASDTKPAALPTPPGQPASGPGGSQYAHAKVRKCLLGEGSCAYHLYEPDAPRPASAPVVVFLHGYSAVNPRVYGGWIEHLVRRGNTAVYPVYQTGPAGVHLYTTNALAAVKDAFRALRKDEARVRFDPKERWAIVGHSLGCPIGANIAGRAEKEGLPKPRALMLCNGGDANTAMKFVPSILELPQNIPDLLLLAVAGADDMLCGERVSREVFEKSSRVSPPNKNLIHMFSDNTGQPSLSAGHLAPLAVKGDYDTRSSFLGGGDFERAGLRWLGIGQPDALDFYGYWKWFDGLTDAAFHGKHREFALGNTPQQRFMGKWSDGRPVKEPKVELGK